MDGNVQIFDNPEFGSLRTVEIDSIIWFVGIDVATNLGYSKARNALIKYVDSEDKMVAQKPYFGALENIPNRGLTVINESGLYSLVLSSKLPKAKEFKHWITSEVIPSIRKHGAYMTPETIEKILLNPDTIIKIAQQLKDEREKNQILQITNNALTESTERWDAKSILNALIRKYSVSRCKGNFAKAWNVFYKRLEYKAHINLKSRNIRRKTSTPIINTLKESEYPIAIKIATAMCEQVGINTGYVINEVNSSES